MSRNFRFSELDTCGVDVLTVHKLSIFVTQLPMFVTQLTSFVTQLTTFVTLYPCSKKTREVLGNLEGGGDGFPNTSLVLVEHGHSLNLSAGSGSGNPSLWTGKDLQC